MKNYSRQREVVINVLRSTNTHPTVNWIYEQARLELPKISLGTVYRNLTQLREDGAVIEVSVGDGLQHFDGDVSEHMHFYCKNCGAILDCKAPANNMQEYVEKYLGCNVDNCRYVFSGLCGDCNNIK